MKNKWFWKVSFYDDKTYEIIAETKCEKSFFVNFFDKIFTKLSEKILKHKGVDGFDYSMLINQSEEFKKEFINNLNRVGIQKNIMNSVVNATKNKYYILTNRISDIFIKEVDNDIAITLKISGVYEHA